MAKFDFCITGVRYNQARTHIDYVRVNEELVGEIGHDRIVPRTFVADLIRRNQVTFQTRTLTSEGKWRSGAKVHVIDEIYLTTNPDNSKRDNLENLPEI